MLQASTLERIFVVRGMQALFEDKMLDFGYHDQVGEGL
jgi:hypothetical protein